MVSIIVFLLLGTTSAAFFNPSGIPKKSEFYFQLNELREKYGYNKSFIKELELASLIALSYFPELSKTMIRFKRSNIKTTMATRPSLGSFFKSKANREYVIYVDDKIVNQEGILVDQVPFNALVGLIGHEYQHILDYTKMSALEIIGLAPKYCFRKFKRKFENETDKAIIERGLGSQLMDWAQYSMHECDASEEYKNFKKENYLSKTEIINIMKSHSPVGP